MTNLTNTAADQIIEREAIRTAKEITASLGDVTVLPEHVNPSDLPGGRWHRFQTEAEVEEWIEANGGEDLAVRDREGWYSIPRPVVGAPVSQGFNGDYYPQATNRAGTHTSSLGRNAIPSPRPFGAGGFFLCVRYPPLGG